LGAIIQDAWGTEIPQWVRDEASVEIWRQSPPDVDDFMVIIGTFTSQI